MPIPQACDTPPTLCCAGWWDVANCFAQCAAGAVRNCIGTACDNLQVYVSHEAPIGKGDYVAAWLASITPANFTQGKQYLAPQMRYRFAVAVCLSGGPWKPVIQGSAPAPVPSAQEHSWASRHTYAAAQAALHALTNQLTVSPHTLVGACTAAAIVSSNPEQPADGSARWRIDIQMDGPVSW